MMPLFSTRILHATAKLLGGKLILDQALLAQKKIDMNLAKSILIMLSMLVK
jgi:hypothetical protein